MSAKNRALKAIRRALKKDGMDFQDTIYASPRNNGGFLPDGVRLPGTIEVGGYCGKARYNNYKERTAKAGWETPVIGAAE